MKDPENIFLKRKRKHFDNCLSRRPSKSFHVSLIKLNYMKNTLSGYKSATSCLKHYCLSSFQHACTIRSLFLKKNKNYYSSLIRIVLNKFLKVKILHVNSSIVYTPPTEND